MPGLVLCHGCFDCLHAGHVLHFQEAKSFGDKLMVSITADDFVKKGIGRPIFNHNERMEMVRRLPFVDIVRINSDWDACDLIRNVLPDVYAKGIDDKGTDCTEFEAVRAYGGDVKFTNAPKFSTTELIERIRG